MRKKVGYPPLPKGKRGVKRKLFGGKEARRARRAERQEDRQERRTARQEARQQARAEGKGLFGQLGAGFKAGRDVREQQRLEDEMPDPNEVTETDPEMTGAVGGGVDTSAAGVGMDTGGGAAKRGGLRDRRRKRRKQKGGKRNPAFFQTLPNETPKQMKERIEQEKIDKMYPDGTPYDDDGPYGEEPKKKKKKQKGGAARAKYAGQKRRVPFGDMPKPDARYESTKDRRRYKITKKGLRTRKSAKRREQRN